MKPATTIPQFIKNFIVESNAIEGIYRDPTEKEILATERFLELDEITLEDLKDYVAVCQPDARLRDIKGLNVRVGAYFPPKGGPGIINHIEDILESISHNSGDDIYSNPFLSHIAYETLHPFTDGNGRSGRVIWLWQMLKLKKNLAPTGFLQSWYYQSLNRVNNGKD